jgi:hypothetical protein
MKMTKTPQQIRNEVEKEKRITNTLLDWAKRYRISKRTKKYFYFLIKDLENII